MRGSEVGVSVVGTWVGSTWVDRAWAGSIWVDRACLGPGILWGHGISLDRGPLSIEPISQGLRTSRTVGSSTEDFIATLSSSPRSSPPAMGMVVAAIG